METRKAQKPDFHSRYNYTPATGRRGREMEADSSNI